MIDLENVPTAEDAAVAVLAELDSLVTEVFRVLGFPSDSLCAALFVVGDPFDPQSYRAFSAGPVEEPAVDLTLAAFVVRADGDVIGSVTEVERPFPAQSWGFEFIEPLGRILTPRLVDGPYSWTSTADLRLGIPEVTQDGGAWYEYDLRGTVAVAVSGEASPPLVRRAVEVSLSHCERVLESRFFDRSEEWPLVPDVLRDAARQTVADAASEVGVLEGASLFDRINIVSGLTYEAEGPKGRLRLGRYMPNSGPQGVDFRETASLDNAKTVRKMLEVAARDLDLVSDGSTLHGFIHAGLPEDPDELVVDFADLQLWDIRCRGDALLRYQRGAVLQPRPRLTQSEFDDRMSRLGVEVDTETLWRAASGIADMPHGGLVVISAEAESEARRLSATATLIRPRRLDRRMAAQLARVDGALLMDLDGVCHAFGVILDGTASPGRGSPQRGARYNSALRYLYSQVGPTAAIIVSDDGPLEIFTNRDDEAGQQRDVS